MIQKEVTAKVPVKEGRNSEELGPATILVDYPETVEEAIEWTTEEALLSNAFANWRVTIQANMRTALLGGMDEEAIQNKLGKSVMGVAQTGGRVDVQTAFIAKFKTATPEKQAEMLEMLRTAAQD